MFSRVGPFVDAPRLLGLLPLLMCGVAAYFAAWMPAEADAAFAAARADVVDGHGDAPDRELWGLWAGS